MAGSETVPSQGDLIWIDAEPHDGHEYGGHNSAGNIRRPMLVISSELYNQRTGFVVGFPITSAVPAGFFANLKITGTKVSGYAILSNLLECDYEARHGEIIDHASNSLKKRALEAVKDIFGIF